MAENSLQTRNPGMPISKAAVLGLSLALGTGAINPVLTSPMTSVGPNITFSIRPRKATTKFDVLDAREQIIAIRSLLGLNVSELAAILHVQRPTVYSWQAGTAEPHLENAACLRRAYELAMHWSRLCSEPIGEWVRKPLDQNGLTLVLLLAQDSPNELLIEDALSSIKVRIEEESLGFVDLSERARKLGYKERSKGKQEASANRETIV